MGYKVITPRASPVIVLADLKAHLRVTVSTEDTYIASLLETACAYVQSVTNNSIGAQTVELYSDAFPDGTGSLELQRGPVTGVTSVQYYDVNGTLQTLSASLYVLDNHCVPSRLTLAVSAAWPATRVMDNAVRVLFSGGSAALDDGVRGALLLLVGHLYENREAVNVGNIVTKMPLSAEALLDGVRDWSM